MMKAAAEEGGTEVVDPCTPYLEMIHGQCVALGQVMTSMETLCGMVDGVEIQVTKLSKDMAVSHLWALLAV